MNLLKYLSIVLLNLFFALTSIVYAASSVPVNARLKTPPRPISVAPKPISAAPNAPKVVNKPVTAAAAQVTSIRDCLKSYQLSSDKLFYVALSAINNSNYKIVEIQSHGAKVLFQAESKEFLLSVSKKDNQNSFVKITPANNSYFFPNTIVKRIYSYIDLNSSVPVQKII